MRRATIKRMWDGRWIAIITDQKTGLWPRTHPLFYKSKRTHADALAWALGALREYYMPERNSR